MKLPIQYLKPGMKVAYPVYGAKGELLLKGESELTQGDIDGLKNRRILALYVKTNLIREEELNEAQNILNESIRIETLALIQEWAERKGPRTYIRVEETVKNILLELLDGKLPVYGLAEVCTVDAYTYAHSVDVCILSAMMGCHMNLKRSDILKLALGSLLHDLGKTKIDKRLLNKPDRLTQTEMSLVKKHPGLGIEMIGQTDACPVARHIVLNHHERYNGSGYPYGLAREQIHEYASICGICDTYSAMTADRSYRKALPPNEVYEMLMGSAGRLFPMRVVRAFLRCVAPYPLGTLVKLSTGEIALVVAIEHSLPLHPEVVVLRTNEKIKLSEELSVTVTGHYSPEEAQNLIMQRIRRGLLLII